MFISLASVSSLSPGRSRRLDLLTVHGSFMTSQVPRLFTSPKLGIIPSFKVSKVATAVGTYLLTRYFSDQTPPNSRINLSISKDSPKVKHVFDIEDIGTKAVYCRCWRSKKFPYCDGAHSKHNDETGDNIGPLVIKRKGP